jgi:hypothetical protein
MNDTPETDDAWDAVSRTPDGMYDSRVPIRKYAHAMAEHSRKMERERDEAREQRDRLAEACRMLMDIIGPPGDETWADTNQIERAWHAGKEALAKINQAEP